MIGEWIANGRRADYRQVEGLTIARILAEFVAHARSYYSASNEFENFRQAMSPLKRLYAATIASEFGPRALAALQQEMTNLGWCRTHSTGRLPGSK